mgnify:CR=1 FL=1
MLEPAVLPALAISLFTTHGQRIKADLTKLSILTFRKESASLALVVRREKLPSTLHCLHFARWPRLSVKELASISSETTPRMGVVLAYSPGLVCSGPCWRGETLFRCRHGWAEEGWWRLGVEVGPKSAMLASGAELWELFSALRSSHKRP